MKVVILHPIQDIHAGSTKALLYLVSQAKQYGVEYVVGVPGQGKLIETLDAMKISHLNLNFKFALLPSHYSLMQCLALLRRYIINLFAGVKLAFYVKKNHIDIIHSNVSVIDVGYLASRLTHTKHIYHIREYADLDFGWKRYFGRRIFLYQLANGNQYSISITKDIQSHYGLINNENSRVIYNGVMPEDSSFYSPIKLPYFLYVGRIQKAKGIIPLLEAYASYCDIVKEPIPLRIAGDTENVAYKREIMNLIDNLNLGEKIQVLGMLDDVWSLYKSTVALVFPSLSEGFGRPIPEAMFMGALTIGNNTGGTKEQFDNGKELTGEEIGLRYSTQEQLVQHLLDVTHALKNNSFTATYEPMILRGQRTVRELYSNEHYVEQVVKFYKEILSNNTKLE